MYKISRIPTVFKTNIIMNHILLFFFDAFHKPSPFQIKDQIAITVIIKTANWTEIPSESATGCINELGISKSSAAILFSPFYLI